MDSKITPKHAEAHPDKWLVGGLYGVVQLKPAA